MTPLGIVHQLRHVNFYKVETVNEGGVGGKKSQKLVNIVCERPLTPVFNENIRKYLG